MTAESGAVPAPRANVIAAFAAVYIIWGSTYLAIRYAVETIPPFLMGGARFLISGILLYAFTRLRAILMNGVELDALRTKQVALRMSADSRVALAKLMRVEQHQATLINWLISADHSPLETTIAYEQVAIEVTAAIAQAEPDPYMAQVYRYGLL